MTNLLHTSVPPWAHGSSCAVDDGTGTSYLLVGVGPDTASMVRQWSDDLVAYPLASSVHDDVDQAGAWLGEALSRARVGTRVRLAGPAGACLHLVSVARATGLEDDEISVAATGAGEIAVFCTHCRASTWSSVGIGDTVMCAGCRRELLVYHHVSRRRGQFMGFMADAEVAET